MIFEYSIQQREALEAIDKRFHDMYEKWANTQHQDMELRKQILDFEYWEEEYKRNIQQFEKIRFNRIKNNLLAIIEDGTRRAKDSILYIYLRIAWLLPEYTDTDGTVIKTDPPRIVGNWLYKMPPCWTYRVWDLENEFKTLKRVSKKFDPNNAKMLLFEPDTAEFIESEFLSLHFAALKGTPEEDELRQAVQQIIHESAFTTDERPDKRPSPNRLNLEKKLANPLNLLKLHHSNLVSNLSKITRMTSGKKTGNYTTFIEKNISVKIKNYEALKTKPGVFSQKILVCILTSFTRNESRSEATISYDFLEYLFGESNNTDSAKRKFKQRVKEGCEMLLSLQVSGTEKIKGKERFFAFNIIDGFFDRGDYITVTLTQSFAEVYPQFPLTSIPKELFDIPSREENAFWIGRKMCEHYYNRSNSVRGRNNRLRIETLLNASTLPSYNQLCLDNNKKYWKKRIFEPLMNALDSLKKHGVIKNWTFVGRGGVPLSENELACMTDNYELLANTLIQFEMTNELPEEEKKKITIQKRRRKKAIGQKKKEPKTKTD